MSQNVLSGFLLRNSAGMWNLLDLNHPELSYKAPLRLNETAAEIWKKLEAGLTFDEIIVNLSESYDVSEEEVRKDVYEFKEKLKAFGVPF